jgi:hypothetical protein
MARFAEHIVNRLFSIGLSLDSAHSIIGKGPAGYRVATATSEVDRLIREIRDHVFAERTPAGLPRTSRPGDQQRPALPTDRAALLHDHMARAARALQASAANYAALLEQRAGLTRHPGRADYPAEIKRWQAFADQAEQMARRWEQPPLPRSRRRPATIKRQRRDQAARPADHLDGHTPGIAEMDLPEGSLQSNPAVSVVWAAEFWQFPAWATGKDLMFADAAGWNRPIRFAHGAGGHMAALEAAGQARQYQVKRLVGSRPVPRCWS